MINPQHNLSRHLMLEKIKQYFKDKNNVIAVYLFGSYAQDQHHHGSDVDIGILFKNDAILNYKKKRNRYMIDLSRILRKDIHPVILNLASEELVKQIFLKGKKLAVNDEKKFSYYRMIMLSRIVDFNYYKVQMQKGFIKKLIKGSDNG